MNVNLWLKKTKEEIDALDAELLVLEILHEKERSFLVANDNIELNQNDLDVLDRLVKLRKRGMPLAYIVGRKEFYGREFAVDRNVLIPRPESEEIIEIVKSLKLKEPKILDVGTGSGCLAITLALEIEKSKVVAADISKEALKVAAENAVDLGARVEFVESDLLEKFQDEKFDVVVANLPYVDETWDWLSEELEWEPEKALFAVDEGLYEIKRLIDEVDKYKNTEYLVIEADESQHEKIKKYISKKKSLEVVKTSGFQILAKKSPR